MSAEKPSAAKRRVKVETDPITEALYPEPILQSGSQARSSEDGWEGEEEGWEASPVETTTTTSNALRASQGPIEIDASLLPDLPDFAAEVIPGGGMALPDIVSLPDLNQLADLAPSPRDQK